MRSPCLFGPTLKYPVHPERVFTMFRMISLLVVLFSLAACGGGGGGGGLGSGGGSGNNGELASGCICPLPGLLCQLRGTALGQPPDFGRSMARRPRARHWTRITFCVPTATTPTSGTTKSSIVILVSITIHWTILRCCAQTSYPRPGSQRTSFTSLETLMNICSFLSPACRLATAFSGPCSRTRLVASCGSR